MENTRNTLWKWDDLIRFQLDIANRWLKKGQDIEDIFAKFFFYFAGINALYFLWGKIDGLEKDVETRIEEWKHLQELLKKFKENEATAILDKVSSEVKYFCKRRPIQKMEKRTIVSQQEGDEWIGRNSQQKLHAGKSSVEKLVALGDILYIVRSNLIHGSKQDSGDDKNIIAYSIRPLETILARTITLTIDKCP